MNWLELIYLIFISAFKMYCWMGMNPYSGSDCKNIISLVNFY